MGSLNLAGNVYKRSNEPKIELSAIKIHKANRRGTNLCAKVNATRQSKEIWSSRPLLLQISVKFERKKGPVLNALHRVEYAASARNPKGRSRPQFPLAEANHKGIYCSSWVLWYC